MYNKLIGVESCFRRKFKSICLQDRIFQFMATVPDALTACLTVYRGSDERSRRTRFSDAESDEIRFTLSQGYNVTHAILVAHLRSIVQNQASPTHVFAPHLTPENPRSLDLEWTTSHFWPRTSGVKQPWSNKNLLFIYNQVVFNRITVKIAIESSI